MSREEVVGWAVLIGGGAIGAFVVWGFFVLLLSAA